MKISEDFEKMGLTDADVNWLVNRYSELLRDEYHKDEEYIHNFIENITPGIYESPIFWFHYDPEWLLKDMPDE